MRYDGDPGPGEHQARAGGAPGEPEEGSRGVEPASREDRPRGRRAAAARRGAGAARMEEAPHTARFHGYAMGYLGGALRSRGSYEAGQLRSGLNEYDEFEFEWGEGYVGGRGYGGTNYDYEHGYRLGRRIASAPAEEVAEVAERGRAPAAGEARGARARGPARGAEPGARGRVYGPARYGYGPYYERLRRVRRSDEEIRRDVEETLFYDTWVDADRIEVEVKDGVVTLRGTLPSYEEVRYAVDDAWEVQGVRGVRSELRVDSEAEGRALGHAAGGGAGEGGGPAGPGGRAATVRGPAGVRAAVKEPARPLRGEAAACEERAEEEAPPAGASRSAGGSRRHGGGGRRAETSGA